MAEAATEYTFPDIDGDQLDAEEGYEDTEETAGGHGHGVPSATAHQMHAGPGRAQLGLQVRPGQPVSMDQALAQMMQTQAMMASVLSDRADADGLLGLGEGGAGATGAGLKGAALVMRNRARFLRDPEAAWTRFEAKSKERLTWEEGDIWSAERTMQLIPWGHFRTLKRFYYLLSKIHRAERSNNRPLVRGLVAQGLKMTAQTVLDHGNFEGSWTLMPFEDPVQPGQNDPMPPPLEQADPLQGFSEPEEIAASMAYLRDMGGLAKARAERLRASTQLQGRRGRQAQGQEADANQEEHVQKPAPKKKWK